MLACIKVNKQNIRTVSEIINVQQYCKIKLEVLTKLYKSDLWNLCLHTHINNNAYLPIYLRSQYKLVYNLLFKLYLFLVLLVNLQKPIR